MCGKMYIHIHACLHTPTHVKHVFMVVLLPALVKNYRLLLPSYDTASFIACRISNMIASVTHLNQKKKNHKKC